MYPPIIMQAKRAARELLALSKQIDRATTAVVLGVVSSSVSYAAASAWLSTPFQQLAITIAGAGFGILLSRVPYLFDSQRKPTVQELREAFEQLEEMKIQTSNREVKAEITRKQIELVQIIFDITGSRAIAAPTDVVKQLPPPGVR